MTQQSINVSEALRRAREEDQDVFLASLNKEQLEKSGFDTSVFGSFELVNVYLLWDGEFVLKYMGVLLRKGVRDRGQGRSSRGRPRIS